MLKGLVEQQGSGLVFVPGRRGREATFLNSPLKDLYPVELDPAKPGGIGLQNEAQLMLTSAGKRHWLTRFDSDEERNDELWKQLPGFFWSAAVEKSRPGSEVLAVHSALRNQWGRLPLLVTRAGRQRQGAFPGHRQRLALAAGRGGQIPLPLLGAGRPLDGPSAPPFGEGRHPPELQPGNARRPATPFSCKAPCWTKSGFPIDKGPVTGKVTSPGGRAERLEFAPLEGGWGVFKSAFTAPEAGHYKLEVASEPYGRHLATDLLVARPLLEKQGQPVNAQILAEIAALTRGASFSMADLDKMVGQISLLPEPQPVEKRLRLWSDPWWGGALLLLLTVYWVGRKWAGLV